MRRPLGIVDRCVEFAADLLAGRVLADAGPELVGGLSPRAGAPALMLELALWAAINIVAVHTRPHVPAAQKHRALQGTSMFSGEAPLAALRSLSIGSVSSVRAHRLTRWPATRARADDGGQSCIDQHAVVRQMLETNPGFLPAQGADPDRLCEFVRLDSDTGASNQGAPGTPGTCDGSAWAEQLLANGGSVNELCPCSCPHVLDACAEGVRRTSS